MTMKTISVF
jgi:hypothetical protein